MDLRVTLFLCVVSAARGELTADAGWPPDVTFRLVDGATTSDGRLEVFRDNVWGSICDDGFDDIAAGVACASLGFGSDGKFVENRFGPGTGPIWLDNLRCFGTESSLAECRHSFWGEHDCTHRQDVSIVCHPIVPVQLRLVDGPTPREGRLEVKYNETWGSICDDGFSDDEAAVACSSLGFSLRVYLMNRNGGRFVHNTYGPGTGKIWLDDVRCIGTESSLVQCRHNGWGEHDCAHKEDVSIACMSPTSTTHAPTTTTTTARAALPTTIPPACLYSSRPTIISSTTGWLTSPNYPNNYNSGMECEWLIQAPFTNGLVTLRLHDVDLESSYDVVTLYDGDTALAPVIAVINGHYYYSAADLIYSTSQRYMLVRFYSDYSFTYRGFNATFSSTAAPSTPTTPTTTTTTFDTRTNHQVLWDTNGTITSPNYPLDYNPYTSVSWLIRSTNPNTVVTLTFTAFSTESHLDVCTIYDGMDERSYIMATLSGTDGSTPSDDDWYYDLAPSRPTQTSYTTTQNSMYITFTSDGSFEYSGFRATFQIKPRTGTSTLRTTTRRTVPTTTRRTSTVTRATTRSTFATSTTPNNDNMLIDRSSPSSDSTLIVLNNSSGSITSPRYPNYYTNNAHMSWLIVAPPNGVVTLTVYALGRGICCDYIHLYDGDNTNAPKFNVTSVKDVYTTSQRYMLVRFTPDVFFTGLGFRATYSTTTGSNTSSNWILFATIIASMSTCAVSGICIIAVCVRRRRQHLTRTLRRRYAALRSESDDSEELKRDEHLHSSEADKKENEANNRLQLIFILSGSDDGDWKTTANQGFTTESAALYSDFTETSSAIPAAGGSTEPAQVDHMVLPDVHISRNFTKFTTAFEKY